MPTAATRALRTRVAPLQHVAEQPADDREGGAELEERGEDAADHGRRRQRVALGQGPLAEEHRQPDHRPERGLRADPLQDQPDVGPPVEDAAQVGAADPVVVVAAGGEHRGQLGFALPALDVVGEQVGDGGDQPGHGEHQERASPVGRPEQTAGERARQGADPLGESPEAQHQAASARCDQVGDDGEADRPHGAQPDRGDQLREQERRVAGGEPGARRCPRPRAGCRPSAAACGRSGRRRTPTPRPPPR